MTPLLHLLSQVYPGLGSESRIDMLADESKGFSSSLFDQLLQDGLLQPAVESQPVALPAVADGQVLPAQLEIDGNALPPVLLQLFAQQAQSIQLDPSKQISSTQRNKPLLNDTRVPRPIADLLPLSTVSAKEDSLPQLNTAFDPNRSLAMLVPATAPEAVLFEAQSWLQSEPQNTSLTNMAQSGQSGQNFSLASMIQNQNFPNISGNTPVLQFTPLNLQQSGWEQHLGERVIWAASQGMRAVHLQLNPPELGPLKIELNLQSEQLSIQFSTHSVQAKEALDFSLPKLREMFHGTEIKLTEVQVGHSSQHQHHQHQEKFYQRLPQYFSEPQTVSEQVPHEADAMEIGSPLAMTSGYFDAYA